jgi:hypothetical protein
MDTRVQGVGHAFKKLIDKGLYYKYTKLRRANEKVEPDGPGPFNVLPMCSVGSGGTDKPDNPSESRIIGDQTSPHPVQDVRERNSPHGPPDGERAVSLNDMMGPTPGTVPRGQRLDENKYPMPDPEHKTRPRYEYRNAAILSYFCALAGTYMAGTKDDGRHMFFQFEMAPEEERTCCFMVLIPFAVLDSDGKPVVDTGSDDWSLEWWLVLVVGTCMNMGSRNASKIAQRFTDRLLEGFSRQLDVYVEKVWLPKQNPAFRANPQNGECTPLDVRREARCSAPCSTCASRASHRDTSWGPHEASGTRRRRGRAAPREPTTLAALDRDCSITHGYGAMDGSPWRPGPRSSPCGRTSTAVSDAGGRCSTNTTSTATGSAINAMRPRCRVQ